jgi:hypothetical protein
MLRGGYKREYNQLEWLVGLALYARLRSFHSSIRVASLILLILGNHDSVCTFPTFQGPVLLISHKFDIKYVLGLPLGNHLLATLPVFNLVPFPGDEGNTGDTTIKRREQCLAAQPRRIL